MTPDQINIAIAEACGWTPLSQLAHPEFKQAGMMVSPKTKTPSIPPRYCSDLNAMHEAEKQLAKSCDWMQYVDHIRLIVLFDSDEQPNFDASTVWCMIHSSARQRAEAFLRVKGLWKE